MTTQKLIPWHDSLDEGSKADRATLFTLKYIFSNIIRIVPVPVAARSKA